jgi:hypothetical protein
VNFCIQYQKVKKYIIPTLYASTFFVETFLQQRIQNQHKILLLFTPILRLFEKNFTLWDFLCV